MVGSQQQEAVFTEFRSKLALEHVSAWDAQVEAYEQNPTLPDPYYRRVEGTLFHITRAVSYSQ